MKTNPRIEKKPLDFSKYEAHGISQDYMAFEINVSNITQEQWDNLESDYQAQGYKIFSSQMEREDIATYKCKIVVAKMGFVF